MTNKIDLHKLDILAKQYSDSYASPHHVTFSVTGLQKLIEATQQSSAIPEHMTRKNAGYFYNLAMHALIDVDAPHGGCKYRLEHICEELLALMFEKPLANETQNREEQSQR